MGADHRLSYDEPVPNPLVVVATEVRGPERLPIARGLWIWCPGCDQAHRPRTALEDGSTGPDPGPIWEWNGHTDERFTISPSLLVHGALRCHSFIRDGLRP